MEAKDDKTVVFTLNTPNDKTFCQLLVTSAGPIVDEETYPADKVLDDDAAVKAQGFSGPYTIGKYTKGQIAEFKANADNTADTIEANADNAADQMQANASNAADEVRNEGDKKADAVRNGAATTNNSQ